MYAFDFKRPNTLEEAAALAHGEAKLLAGGQTLIPTLKQRLAAPSMLVDLAGIAALRGISVTDERVTIGAMTRHAEVAFSSAVKAAIPALADLAGNIGDRMVRNMGTIGGSIANNDPAADYPGAVVALGATVQTAKRAIPGDVFFTGMFSTALDEGEIITAVSFPVPARAAYVKFPNPASRYAMVGAFVAKSKTGAVRVAITGAGACVFRVAAMEERLTRDFSPQAIADIRVSEDGLNADIHATSAYRAHLVTVMAMRAVEKAAG
jgi:carbon-monoxide dehydrogenase medium subunit